jgi:hypothetical protein
LVQKLAEVVPMIVRRALVLVLMATFLTAGGCGGGSGSSGPTTTPTPTPAATPTPAPAPTPTPAPRGTPDPRTFLPDGPVATYTVKVRTIQTCRPNANPGANCLLRDKVQDPDGSWVICRGDFVVFDSDQRNALGDKCKFINLPVWSVRDPDDVLDVLGSSEPFLLRTDVRKAGELSVTGSIDGIQANTLRIRSRGNGCPPIAADQARAWQLVEQE